MRYFDLTRTGRIISRVDRDVESLQQALIFAPTAILSILFRMVGSTIVIYLIAPSLLPALFSLLPVLLITMYVANKFGGHLWQKAAESKSAVSAHFVESITGVHIIQQANAIEADKEQFHKTLSELDLRGAKATLGWSWFGPYSMVLFMVGAAALVIQGGPLYAAEEITLGQLVQCIFYVFLFLGPLQELGDLMQPIAEGSVAGKRIFLMLDSVPEIKDSDKAQDLAVSKGAIEFSQVNFAYLPDKPVIRDLTLSIPAGQTLAIVGPTGHGKSTMVQLLTRFYDIDAGSICIDGQNVSDCKQASIHQHIGIVLQDNVLFSGSIYDNIRLAQPDASDEDITQACKDLGIDEALSYLPNGLDTVVGQEGVRLSLGQRQLVCLVRALYR